MFRMTVVAVMCFVASACGAPQRQETYEKGAYRPVRAPTFTPTEDAPHTFSPGKPPRVEPGPRPGRVLPETPETRREPGLWSGNPPRGAVDDPIPETPLLAGVLLPYPPDAVDELDKRPTRLCARDMNFALEALNLKEAVEGLPKASRACLAAILYRECAIGNEKLYEDLKTKAEGIPSPGADERVRAHTATALEFEKRQCSKPPPAGVGAIAAKVVPLWRQFAIVPEAQ